MNPGRRFVRCKFYILVARRRGSRDGNGCNYWRWVDEGNNGWQTDVINALLSEKKDLQNEVDMWKDKFSCSEVEKQELRDELTKMKKKKSNMKIEKGQQYGMGFYVLVSVTISVVIMKIFS